MKKILFGTSFLLSSLIAPSFAEESKNLYLSIGGGITFPSDVKVNGTDLNGTDYKIKLPTDNPFIYSLAVGKGFEDLRLEFNYSGTTLSSKSITATVGGTTGTANFSPAAEAKVKSYMLYGYKDITNETKFTPYIGIGLGTSNINMKEQTINSGGATVILESASSSVFTYGIKGGVGYEIADNTSLYSEATYLNYASFKDGSDNYDSNNYFGITAGLRFNF
mgnify:CR=1 FL=1